MLVDNGERSAWQELIDKRQQTHPRQLHSADNMKGSKMEDGGTEVGEVLPGNLEERRKERGESSGIDDRGCWL